MAWTWIPTTQMENAGVFCSVCIFTVAFFIMRIP